MRRLLAAIVLMLLAPVAFAGKPTPERIDRLLELTKARLLVDGTLDQLVSSQRAMMEQMLQGKDLSAGQRAKLDRILALMDKRTRETLAWEKLRPMYHRVYAESFEAEDVDAMIAFYETPSGQRVIERMPTLMQNTMQEIMVLIVPMMEQFQKDLEAEVKSPSLG